MSRRLARARLRVVALAALRRVDGQEADADIIERAAVKHYVNGIPVHNAGHRRPLHRRSWRSDDGQIGDVRASADGKGERKEQGEQPPP